ncbi:MAG TPA: tetratricopeptide repeat protein [Thermoanaerobaculia bacterium]|nr:tetratricopeptide repeat protein [Thermoanaerobaculia bacterium]
MRALARALGCALLLLSGFTATAAHAADQGRLLGTVVDAAGAPLAAVKVIITSPDMATYRVEKTTDAHGQFSAIILDAQRQYRIHLEKQGYVTLEQPLKLKIEDTLRESYSLQPATGPAAAGPQSGGAAAAGAPPAGQPAGASGKAAPAPPPADAAEAKAKHDAAVAYNEGVTALKAKDMQTATAKFEQAATVDPKLAEAHAILAGLYLEQHRPADALAAADRALALEPGKPRVMMDRYQALKDLGDKQRAAQALAALAASHPGPELARDVAVSLYNEAADALREKHVEDATADLKRAIEVDRTLEPAYGALANIDLTKKDYSAALDVADRWVAATPQSLSALQLRYRVLSELKDPRAQQAKAAMDGAKGDASNPLNHGIELYNGNRIPEATKVFESVLQADPKNARAHYMLGLCYTNTGDLARAKEHLETFLLLAPNDPEAQSARQMLAELK